VALEITISADRLKEIQDQLGGIDKLDFSPISAIAAEQAVLWGTRAFKDESKRPSPWAPWSPAYEKRLKGAWTAKHSTKSGKLRKSAGTFEADRQLLIDTGGLKDGLAAKVDGGHAYISSDREYAAYHQFGAPKAKLPARPFLPIEADFSLGTAVLTDAAWESIRPLLERKLKQLILSSR
jgi:phage gpG-like protein